MTDIDFEKMERDWDYDKKSCKGCQYRFKDTGQLSKRNDEVILNIYGCRLGNISNLTKYLPDLPENCQLVNFEYIKDTKNKEDKKVNNCKICNIYQDYKPICKKLEVLNCPCKFCPDFLVTDKTGCINYTKKCLGKLKYKEIKGQKITIKE